MALRVFIELNEWEWTSYPSVDGAERLMLEVAGGARNQGDVNTWLATHIRPIR